MTFRAAAITAFRDVSTHIFDALQLPKAANKALMLRGTCMLAALGAARALVLPRRCAARSLIRYATETERGAPKLPKGAFRPKQSLGQNYLQDPNIAARARRLVSQKFGGLRRFRAIFMNRLRERRRWVVSFPILRPFLTETVPSAHRRASSTRCSAIRNEVRGWWNWVLVWAP